VLLPLIGRNLLRRTEGVRLSSGRRSSPFLFFFKKPFFQDLPYPLPHGQEKLPFFFRYDVGRDRFLMGAPSPFAGERFPMEQGTSPKKVGFSSLFLEP